MKAKPECLPCAFNQILNLRHFLPDLPEEIVLEALQEAVRRLSTMDLAAATPAQIATECLLIGAGRSGNPDPFCEAKRLYNSVALELVPGLQARIDRLPEGSPARLSLALQIAVAGNFIDLGLFQEVDVAQRLDEVFRAGFAVNDLDRLVAALAGARRVLYVADNAGEIVLDCFAVQELARRARVTVAVKEGPISNDALLGDAMAAGLDRLAELITTGERALGVSPSASPAFWSAFRSADLVIAKGQANFESLDLPHPNLFFLLAAKCPVIAAALGAPSGGAVLRRADPNPR